MAVVLKPSNFPHLLYLHGDDVAQETAAGFMHIRRPGIRTALFSDGNGVGDYTGEVDFVICYIVGGQIANFAGVDHSPYLQDPSRRPLRGIIQLPRDLMQPMSDQQLGRHLSGVAHECSHYWLVPGKSRVRINGVFHETPTSDDIAATLNCGHGVPPAPIIGRGDSHWSPFVHSDGSPLDGIDHDMSPDNVVTEAVYGYSVAKGVAGSGVEFSWDGIDMATSSRFNEFELTVMGLPPAEDSPTGHALEVLEPNQVFPLPFHAGLFLRSADGRPWYAGFHQRPTTIAVIAADSEWTAGTLHLPGSFNPENRIALRAVQRADTVEVQARMFEPLRLGCWGQVIAWLNRLGVKTVLGPEWPHELDCSDIAKNWSGDTGDDPLTSWVVVATIQGPLSEVGIGSRHLGAPCFVQLRPKVLCLATPSTQSDVDPQGLTLVNPVDFSDPSFGSTRLEDGSLVLPYRPGPGQSAHLEHTATTDAAPRLVAAAPQEDFVFGGELALARCVIVNWAGGAGRNRTYVGHRRSIAYEDIDYISPYPPTHHWPIRQADPHGGAYRFVFCLVSRDPLPDQDLDDQLQTLDRIRRAWEPCFAALTAGRRLAHTETPFASP